MLIGGFQDMKGVIQCLYVKLDRPQADTGNIIVAPYDSAGAEREEFRKKVEEIVNNTHIEDNGILRCALTFGGDHKKTHYFIFETNEKLQYYLILNFPQDLQDRLNHLSEKEKSHLATDN